MNRLQRGILVVGGLLLFAMGIDSERSWLSGFLIIAAIGAFWLSASSTGTNKT